MPSSEVLKAYEGEKDSKQGRREDTALFDATLDGVNISDCSILSHCAFHVAVEGCDQLWWTANLFQ